MQIPVSVFICVHPWLKKKLKSTAKTTAGVDHYGCSFSPVYGEKDKNHARMDSDGRGLKRSPNSSSLPHVEVWIE